MFQSGSCILVILVNLNSAESKNLSVPELTLNWSAFLELISLVSSLNDRRYMIAMILSKRFISRKKLTNIPPYWPHSWSIISPLFTDLLSSQNPAILTSFTYLPLYLAKKFLPAFRHIDVAIGLISTDLSFDNTNATAHNLSTFIFFCEFQYISVKWSQK